jgi:hypothetical protein
MIKDICDVSMLNANNYSMNEDEFTANSKKFKTWCSWHYSSFGHSAVMIVKSIEKKTVLF